MATITTVTTSTTYPTTTTYVVLPPIIRMSRNPGAYKDLGKEASGMNLIYDYYYFSNMNEEGIADIIPFRFFEQELPRI
jgi:hypothetical protein